MLRERHSIVTNQIHTEKLNPFSIEKTIQKGSKITIGIKLKNDAKERISTTRMIPFFGMGNSNNGFT